MGSTNLLVTISPPVSEPSPLAWPRYLSLAITGTSGELTAEPGSFVDDVPVSDASDSLSVGSQSTDSKYWKPAPKELIQLFVEEFGELAPEGEEEEVILEADAALFVDVAIVVCIDSS